MASSKDIVFVFFLLITLLSTLQTHARDSHLFSKFTRNRPSDTTNPNYNYHNHHEDLTTTFPKQQEQEEEKVSQNGYGLYGHETGLDAPSTTTTATLSSLNDVGGEKYDIKNNFDNNNFENFEGAGYNVGAEKQGMSDTRYLENGKYYYDINDEKSMRNYHVMNALSYKNNNNNNNFNDNNLKNNKNNGEYYNQYNDNNNYNGNGNGMNKGYNGYKNQFSDEEFDFDDQP